MNIVIKKDQMVNIRKGVDMQNKLKSSIECSNFGSGWCCNKGTTGHCCNS